MGRRSLLVLGAVSLAACGETLEPIACTEQFVYGLNVTVVDALTGAQRAEGSTLTLREGSWEEVVTEVFGNNTLSAAGERAGTYVVTVTRDGYQSWIETEVTVNEDECHVIPVALLAQLQPVP